MLTKDDGFCTSLITASPEAVAEGCWIVNLGSDLKRFVAFSRCDEQFDRFDPMRTGKGAMRLDISWMLPVYGRKWSNLPRETQFLLWEDTAGVFHAAMALVDGDIRASLCGDDRGVCVCMEGLCPGAKPVPSRVLAIASADNPYDACRFAVEKAQDSLKTFALRGSKQAPEFIRFLGWCTWNAFYRELTGERVNAGLATFKTGGVQPGFLILDDGWFVSNAPNKMTDFIADPAKFPGGLKKWVHEWMADFGLQRIGVWHALTGGFWWGLDRSGPVAQRYCLLSNSVRTCFSLFRSEDPIDLIHPDDIECFYVEFYAYLKQEGIQFVKVDGQTQLELHTAGLLGRGETMQAYQQALQRSVKKNFDGEIMNCMSMSNDVACHMRESVLQRNSLDYYPGAPVCFQQSHVHINALNNLFTSCFALPDWDMFQTHGPVASFHAAARALSGGPVYVSDEPGRQDFANLRALSSADGRVDLCDRPALPTADCILTDCWNEPNLLKITNTAAGVGMVGVFHCSQRHEEISGVVSLRDVREWSGAGKGPWAVWSWNKGYLGLFQSASDIPVKLRSAEFDIFYYSPVQNGFAPLGLAQRYAAPASISNVQQTADRVIVQLTDGGVFSCYLQRKPRGVSSDGKDVPFKWSEGLMSVDLPSGRVCSMTISYA